VLGEPPANRPPHWRTQPLTHSPAFVASDEPGGQMRMFPEQDAQSATHVVLPTQADAVPAQVPFEQLDSATHVFDPLHLNVLPVQAVQSATHVPLQLNVSPEQPEQLDTQRLFDEQAMGPVPQALLVGPPEAQSA
jgi:hypothetical protein